MLDATVQKRVEEVKNLPHVRSWLERFAQLVADKPAEVWVFAGSSLTVLAYDENGDRCMNGEGVEQDAVIASFPDNGWEGGDW